MFLGIGAGKAITPDYSDCMDMVAYGGTGTTRALAQAGWLDILPSHYSQMAAMMTDGRFALGLRERRPDQNDFQQAGIVDEGIDALRPAGLFGREA